MPNNRNATIRYIALDKCFRDDRHRYFIEDLMERCEEALISFNFEGGVCRRQIFDDIRFMESDAGWAIPLDRLKEGRRTYYTYSDRDFSINKQPLTDAEAQQLKTVILTLSRFRGLPTNEWVEEVISNLEWRFNLNGTTESIIGFEQNQALKGLHFLPAIIDAASNHQVLEIGYRSYRNGGRERTFVLHPYYIKQYNNRWFLFGLDDRTRLIPNLALDRILSVAVVPDIAFIPNSRIDFEHYFDDVVGVSLPGDDVQREEIVLRFTKSRFPYVASKPIHRSQQTISETEGIVRIAVKPNRELDQQILSFGADVEVLSPAWYRAEIRSAIESCLKQYETGKEEPEGGELS